MKASFVVRPGLFCNGSKKRFHPTPNASECDRELSPLDMLNSSDLGASCVRSLNMCSWCATASFLLSKLSEILQSTWQETAFSGNKLNWSNNLQICARVFVSGVEKLPLLLPFHFIAFRTRNRTDQWKLRWKCILWPSREKQTSQFRLQRQAHMDCMTLHCGAPKATQNTQKHTYPIHFLSRSNLCM